MESKIVLNGTQTSVEVTIENGETLSDKRITIKNKKEVGLLPTIFIPKDFTGIHFAGLTNQQEKYLNYKDISDLEIEII